MKRIDDETIQVTELPIGMWTDKFKDQCYSLIEKGVMNQLINESTTDKVNFTLKNVQDTTDIKLTSTLHTTNMVLFNHENVITKYHTINDIFEEYFKTRLHFYKLRKDHILAKLKDSVDLNENKLKFILKVVNNENFLKQEDEAIIDLLNEEHFLKVDNTFNYLLNIPVRGCTLNAVKVLRTTISKLKEELVELAKLTTNQMWLKELDEVRTHL
jgi:DNA topoisomerase-2